MRIARIAGAMPVACLAPASLNVIQRQLGHANLGTTSIYLQGIDIEGRSFRLCTLVAHP
jgi:site-specific recombinase XerD